MDQIVYGEVMIVCGDEYAFHKAKIWKNSILKNLISSIQSPQLLLFYCFSIIILSID